LFTRMHFYLWRSSVAGSHLHTVDYRGCKVRQAHRDACGARLVNGLTNMRREYSQVCRETSSVIKTGHSGPVSFSLPLPFPSTTSAFPAISTDTNPSSDAPPLSLAPLGSGGETSTGGDVTVSAESDDGSLASVRGCGGVFDCLRAGGVRLGAGSSRYSCAWSRTFGRPYGTSATRRKLANSADTPRLHQHPGQCRSALEHGWYIPT
jgi:hypothetical protein